MTFSFIMKNKRKSAGIIAIMMLVLVLSSAALIAAEAGHDCHGGHCPVCDCLHQCAENLQAIGRGVIFTAITLLTFTSLHFSEPLSVLLLPISTPVSRKIRLNN